MIWATVSSWFCFCWLYRASPSLAAKNIINLISVLNLVMSMHRVFSCVVGRGCLLWPVHFLGKTLLVFALLHSVFQGQICLLLQVFLDVLLLHSSSLQWKGHLFWVLVLKDLVGLHITVQLQFNWKRSVFIPIPKKSNAKECSNYCTIALIFHASKVMLKIFQASLQ